MFFALNIFGGNAPYLPAFRWGCGGFPLLRPHSSHSRPLFHSREGGNLCGDSRIRRQATLMFPLRGISRWRGKRFPLSREWKGEGNGSIGAGMEKGGRNEKGGEREWNIFLPAAASRPLFHSRESGNLAGRHRPPRIAAGDIALPLRGISRWRGKRFPLSREWKGGAGMEVSGREWKREGGMEKRGEREC